MKLKVCCLLFFVVWTVWRSFIGSFLKIESFFDVFPSFNDVFKLFKFTEKWRSWKRFWRREEQGFIVQLVEQAALFYVTTLCHHNLSIIHMSIFISLYTFIPFLYFARPFSFLYQYHSQTNFIPMPISYSDGYQTNNKPKPNMKIFLTNHINTNILINSYPLHDHTQTNKKAIKLSNT